MYDLLLASKKFNYLSFLINSNNFNKHLLQKIIKQQFPDSLIFKAYN